MVATPKGSLDDNLRQLIWSNFSGGWVTQIGPLELSGNQFPDSLNIIPYQGYPTYRGGSTKYSAIPFATDEAYEFYDSANIRHYAIWAGGNLYDVAAGAPTLIVANCYTAGTRIGRQQFNGTLYWSTRTVPIQFWTPQGGTFGPVITTGTDAPPTSEFLFLYNGAIVALAPTYNGFYQSAVFTWSGTNMPTYWTAANSQSIAGLDGGQLVYGGVFGISDSGVAPIEEMVIAKTGSETAGLYLFSGALGALSPSAVNCPTTVLDAKSAIYIPSAEGLGQIVFIGQDFQLWGCTGINANVLSGNIAKWLFDYLTSVLNSAPTTRLYATYLPRFQSYVVNFGALQVAYHWPTKALYKLSGWPYGPFLNGVNKSGFPAIYIASATAATGLYLTGVDYQGDSGVVPSIYLTTPYIHCGSITKEKEYFSAGLLALNESTAYNVSGSGLMRSDGSTQTIQSLLFNLPLVTATPANSLIWGQGQWGVNYWGSTQSLANQKVAYQKGYIACPVPQSDWIPPGMTEPLRSNAAQFTISYASGVIDFRLAGLTIEYNTRGGRFPGAQKYETTSGVTQVGANPFTGYPNSI